MGFSKRGQTAPDVATVIIMLFIFGIVIIFAYKALKDVNTDFQADASFTAEAKASLQTVEDHYASTWDGLFAFALVLLWIFLIVTAFFVDTHPIFFIITVLLLFCLFAVTPIIANTFDDVTSDEDVVAERAEFPIMIWVFQHLLLVVIVLSVSAGVALYAKNRT